MKQKIVHSPLAFQKLERVLMGKSDYIRKILGSIPEEDEERGAE